MAETKGKVKTGIEPATTSKKTRRAKEELEEQGTSRFSHFDHDSITYMSVGPHAGKLVAKGPGLRYSKDEFTPLPLYNVKILESVADANGI